MGLAAVQNSPNIDLSTPVGAAGPDTGPNSTYNLLSAGGQGNISRTSAVGQNVLGGSSSLDF